MNNTNSTNHRHTGVEKELSDAVTALAMPGAMADELLENCVHARHSRNILFRHSKLIAAALLIVLSTTLCTTTYAAYDLYQTKNLAVFFDYNISQAEIDAIGKEIRALPGVSSIRFESADEAWASFRETYLTDELAGMFEENPLKDSFNYRVTVKLDADTKEIRGRIEQICGVRRVNDLSEMKQMETAGQIF